MNSTQERIRRLTDTDANGCWLWTASKDRGGYGRVEHNRKTASAHRVAYQAFVGPITEGLELDHLCRVRSCVNPAHLEPVTHSVNVRCGVGAAAVHAARTHCPEGHPYDMLDGGRRRCRECRNRLIRERRRRGAR